MAQRLQEAFQGGKLDERTFVSLLQAVNERGERASQPAAAPAQAPVPAQGQYSAAYPAVPNLSTPPAAVAQALMPRAVGTADQPATSSAGAAAASNSQDLGTLNDFFLKLGHSVAMELQTFMEQQQRQSSSVPGVAQSAAQPVALATPGHESIYPAVPTPTTAVPSSSPAGVSGLYTSVPSTCAPVAPAPSMAFRPSFRSASSPGNSPGSLSAASPSSVEQSMPTPHDSPSPATPFPTTDPLPFSLEQLEKDGLTSILGFDSSIFTPAPKSTATVDTTTATATPTVDKSAWGMIFPPAMDHVQPSAAYTQVPQIAAGHTAHGAPDQYLTAQPLGRASPMGPRSRPLSPKLASGDDHKSSAAAAASETDDTASDSSSVHGQSMLTATSPLSSPEVGAAVLAPTQDKAKVKAQLEAHAELIRRILIVLNRPSQAEVDATQALARMQLV